MRKDVRISEVINDNFHEFWKVSKEHKYLKYVLKGGRGSAKSTHIGFRVIMDIMKYPISALVVRKVGNTLSESVYEQLKECAEILGVKILDISEDSIVVCATFYPFVLSCLHILKCKSREYLIYLL